MKPVVNIQHRTGYTVSHGACTESTLRLLFAQGFTAIKRSDRWEDIETLLRSERRRTG